MATFAYLRVSTNDQTTEQQLAAILQAGYVVGERLVYIEQGVSGKIPAMQREQFKQLSNQITTGDSLVVAKLDRLGRDTLDVIATIEALIARGVSVIVLGLGVLDSSPTSRLTLTMLAAISQFERELIGERTKAALAVKKANGVKLGRPVKITDEALKAKAKELLDAGTSWRKTAKELDISLSTLQRMMK
ncbi:MAG TPA: recombinase family protein [Gallionella sp.]|nr:recombinase family protein [Gallionella sp.]